MPSSSEPPPDVMDDILDSVDRCTDAVAHLRSIVDSISKVELDRPMLHVQPPSRRGQQQHAFYKIIDILQILEDACLSVSEDAETMGNVIRNQLLACSFAVAPVSALPPELLTDIFRRCREMGTSPVTLSQVSYRWRQIAIADTNLWTTVLAKALIPDLSLYSSRSLRRNLNLVVSPKCSTHRLAMITLPALSIPCSTVESLDWRHAVTVTSLRDIARSCRQLQKISFVDPDKANGAMDSDPNERTTLQRALFPQLQYLRLENVHLLTGQPITAPKLVHLVLSGMHLDASCLQSILVASPLLETLELHDTTGTYLHREELHIIPHAALRTLVLHDVDWAISMFLLRRHRFPELRCLDVGDTLFSTPDPIEITDDADGCPSRLEFQGSPISIVLRAFFHSIPSTFQELCLKGNLRLLFPLALWLSPQFLTLGPDSPSVLTLPNLKTLNFHLLPTMRLDLEDEESLILQVIGKGLKARREVSGERLERLVWSSSAPMDESSYPPEVLQNVHKLVLNPSANDDGTSSQATTSSAADGLSPMEVSKRVRQRWRPLEDVMLNVSMSLSSSPEEDYDAETEDA